MIEERQDKTSKILAMSLLQYSILIPLMKFVNSTTLVAITGILLIVYSMFVNRMIVINRKLIMLLVGLTLVMIFKKLMGHAGFSTIMYIYIFIIPTLFLFSYSFNHDLFLEYSIKYARVSFFVLFWIPASSSFYSSYMRFGYGMLPSVLFAYVDLIYYQRTDIKGEYNRGSFFYKCLDLIIIIIGTIEMVIFGSRGATFALILFIALERIVMNKRRIIANIVLFITVIVAYYNIVSIFSFIDFFMNRFGLKSYSIMKFERQISKGFAAAASSRDSIYANSIELIKKSPLVGNVIDLDERGGDYVHNIFLQVAQDLGIIMLIVLIVFTIYCLINIGTKKNNRNDRLIILVLFAISFGRLMFSSTMWRRPEFWMLICFVLSLNKIKHNSNVSGDVS